MINFFDLKKLFELNKHEILNAVNDVTNSGWYILGKQVKLFEKIFHHTVVFKIL